MHVKRHSIAVVTISFENRSKYIHGGHSARCLVMRNMFIPNKQCFASQKLAQFIQYAIEFFVQSLELMGHLVTW
jgi:hypothetical protein